MNLTQSGDTAWYATSKCPITDEQGNIIGSYGITRHLEKQAKALSNVEAVKEPVDYLSVSALARRFKKYLTKTPKHQSSS